jgi:hypothetical protein
VHGREGAVTGPSRRRDRVCRPRAERAAPALVIHRRRSMAL